MGTPSRAGPMGPISCRLTLNVWPSPGPRGTGAEGSLERLL